MKKWIILIVVLSCLIQNGSFSGEPILVLSPGIKFSLLLGPGGGSSKFGIEVTAGMLYEEPRPYFYGVSLEADIFDGKTQYGAEFDIQMIPFPGLSVGPIVQFDKDKNFWGINLGCYESLGYFATSYNHYFLFDEHVPDVNTVIFYLKYPFLSQDLSIL